MLSLITSKYITVNLYLIIYILSLISILTFFSLSNSFKRINFKFLSDVSSIVRFPILLNFIFFNISLLSGMPPFSTFLTKFILLSNFNNYAFIIILFIFIFLILIYYLSFFKFLRNFKKERNIENFNYKLISISIILLTINIISIFLLNFLIIDLI